MRYLLRFLGLKNENILYIIGGGAFLLMLNFVTLVYVFTLKCKIKTQKMKAKQTQEILDKIAALEKAAASNIPNPMQS